MWRLLHGVGQRLTPLLGRLFMIFILWGRVLLLDYVLVTSKVKVRTRSYSRCYVCFSGEVDISRCAVLYAL